MITQALLVVALAAPGEPLVDTVKVDNVLAHLQAFQAIADAHGGNRAAGTPGYDASATYVAARLREAGYSVELQPFAFDFYRELAPGVVSSGKRKYGGVTTMAFSGNGSVSAAPQSARLGCTAGDFKTFTAGRIAIVNRGTCTFNEKARNAHTAGAVAVIVVNEEGTFAGSAGVPQPIPVVGVSAATGAKVAKAKKVKVVTKTESETRITHNVLAQTPGTGRAVMVGAHLDSRLEGPGINDNGSGSAAILEIATRLAKQPFERPVRFAWWGAEEQGLLGSTYYVSQLSPAERKQIRYYVNLDMVGSKNHIYGIFDGDDSDNRGFGAGPKGSARVERTFQRYFSKRGLPYTGADFSGRSDYGPFVEAGIAAGGLFTGAEGLKTKKEAEQFGGQVGKPLDGCYHLACDDVKNVDRQVLDETTKAVASVITWLST
ncbi:M20/M25/M40 family metallo-hydrolase [Nonomuraea sp. NBC_01738]|uniref:M28 family peptidase n=1 Tax=Nonomuraea sp. NBC_01738 TaxID=2976003 RepID=UPI002E0F01D5|nr:M20/M25/M40 family metallo-hydrolase [Nonomuraea sp. NBC_01738]